MRIEPDRPDLAYMQKVSDKLDATRKNSVPEKHAKKPDIDLSFEHCYTDGLAGFDDNPENP